MSQTRASLLLHNGVVETMSSAVTRCDSLALRGGNIVAVGVNLAHDSEFKTCRKVDLQGAVVYPGFVDAHTHFYYFAMSLGKAQLAGCQSLKDALARLSKYARTLKRGEWLLAEGLFVSETSFSNLNAAEILDSISGSRPAAVFTRDQHTLWANTAALRLSGIEKGVPDPPGGQIERLNSGAPSGVLRENSAIKLALDSVPTTTRKRENELFHRALRKAHRQGITGVHSFDTWRGFDYFRRQALKGKPGLRVSYYPLASDLRNVELSLGQSLRFGLGDDWFRIAGLKIFADGALGSRTALTHQPYLRSNGATGIEVTSPVELRRLIALASRRKLPCAVHAIGDRAVTNCIEALSACPARSISAKARHRIEHLQMIRRQDIPPLRRGGIVASMQPSHLPDDVADIESCWGARARNCYVFRSLLKTGVPLAFGSDAPIVELSPLAGIRDAVRRRSADGRSILNPAERISAHQAASCFTRGAAYAAGEEDYSGSILPGYRADLTILSHNLRDVKLTNIADVEVVATILDGKVVYSDSGFQI